MNALGGAGAGGGNLRTAISSEPTRKLAGNKLPVIAKTSQEKEMLQHVLIENAFMRHLDKDQMLKVLWQWIWLLKLSFLWL